MNEAPPKSLKTGNLRLRPMVGGILGMAVAMTTPSARPGIVLTDLSGRKATVEITEATPETVSFVLQGRKSSVKMTALSPESRTDVVTYAKSKNVYRSCPPLVVQVKVAKQQRNSDKVWYQKNVRIGSSVVVEGVNKLTGIPPLQARIILITQDTRAKYVKHVEKLTVKLVDEIPIPAAASGDRREFDFKTLELTLDAARDFTNAGGSEYKYFIFGLQEAESKRFLDFQTNCPALETYGVAHPEARATLLSSRPDADFTADFAGK